MLGKILEINNTEIVVENNNVVKDIMNFYVKILSLDKTLIGEIKAFNQDKITIKLMGEVVNNKFIFGVSHKPSFSSQIYFLKDEELDILFGVLDYDSKTHLYLGKSDVYDRSVYLNINNLFANHFVVLGNTGSGKSCGMARILQNIFYKKDAQAYNSTFFIIDAYGEYKNAFKMINYVNKDLNYKNYTTDLATHDEKLIIPLWLLSLDDIALLLGVTSKNQLPIIEKAMQLVNVFFRQEDDYVTSCKNSIIAKAILDILINGNTPAQMRDQIFSVLTRYHTNELNLDSPIYMPGYTRPLKQCLMIDETGKIREMELVINFLNKYIIDDIKLDLPDGSYKYTLKDLLYAFDFALIEEGMLNDPNIYSISHSLRVKLASIINSKDSIFFETNKYYTKKEFMQLLTTKDGKKVQVINLNLQNIDDRLAKNVAKIYAKLIFDYNKELHIEGNNMPMHIVLEEAHRYVQNDSDIEILGYNIFERIAKEGRKYAVLLALISQRPSELSQTVISQSGNFIIFRITHPVDTEYIKAMIPYVDDEILEKIKNLPVGHCLVFGSSLDLPIVVKMDLATPSPTSHSCNISTTWFN